ncbi:MULTISPECIES: nucleotide sugar dehydrogenase [Butyricimonas]|uniref:nucleotide sugar dehydrogenase n=1 Tax=Butyricimonas TaxID=574697 RepID=UPI000C07E670|nr:MULTISPECIES: nucleotide sugar dehydrogenase [Butyricimonas]MCB6972399.1 nucleotide sugar dehydrogenase [Butyricimonas synergistica]MCG4519407.1 nucleotide sugar dehydrogenase [Butyricimonas sp. DFI.6.44]
MFDKLINKEAKLALVGLGYVGLPIALEFAKQIAVIGFDINEVRLAKMREHIDPSDELGAEAFENTDIEFTSSVDVLREASFYIVAVPTPIDRFNQPDLTPLLSASRTVGKALKRGDYVVYESTVYPGCTEEDCVPILEEVSGLRAGVDFKIGYSPERINPGDKVHTLTNTVKIVSGGDAETLETVAKVYELVVKAGVHRAPCIKVAEAGKIIENTQRDVNIALMNELSIICSRIGINTYDVLEAAGTKWNFLKFYPGLVGGHCIGVDPYYLVHKAKELKYHPQMINAGRFVNDTMGGYIAKKIVKRMIAMGKNILGARVLVMGITFKENVADIRNSKVVDIVNELKDFGVDVDVTDPHADPEEVLREYGFSLIEQPRANYDAIIVAVSHKEYIDLDEAYFRGLTYEHAVLGDVKGIYRGKIHQMKYWSL